MHYAVLGNHLGLVKMLLKRGADDKIESFEGNTAYDCAVREGYSDIELYLRDV